MLARQPVFVCRKIQHALFSIHPAWGVCLNHGFKHRTRRSLAKRARHTGRMSRQSLRYAVFIGGAACVGLVSLGFAQLAELMLAWNSALFAR